MPSPTRGHYLTTAGFLLAEAALLTIPVIVLGAVFQFPAILQKPASDVLPLFESQLAVVIPIYYFFMLSSLLLIPLSLLLQRLLARGQETLLGIAVAFGVADAIFKMIGFIRWAFLVPVLADSYTQAGANDATKATVSLIYDAFNNFAGHAVGEHLGFLADVIWGVLIGVALLRSRLIPRWLAALGILFAVGVLGNPLELLGGSAKATFDTIYLTSYSLLTVWLAVVAVLFIINRRPQNILDTAAPRE